MYLPHGPLCLSACLTYLNVAYLNNTQYDAHDFNLNCYQMNASHIFDDIYIVECVYHMAWLTSLQRRSQR